MTSVRRYAQPVARSADGERKGLWSSEAFRSHSRRLVLCVSLRRSRLGRGRAGGARPGTAAVRTTARRRDRRHGVAHRQRPDPGLGGTRLPVLVWIYGGAYMSGSSGDPGYDAALIARAGLVVVTFNYRVGVEGFAQLEGAPANRGLLDQLAALHWVQQNIAGFGGDPERVTVCGQSAGAGSIATLLAVGLFRRAIAQSVPGMYFTQALAADIAAALAARLGTAPTVAGLAEIDPQRLADEVELLSSEVPAHADRWGRAAHVGISFGPSVIAWELAQAWPDAHLHLVGTGHTGGSDMTTRLIAATDRFARHRSEHTQ